MENLFVASRDSEQSSKVHVLTTREFAEGYGEHIQPRCGQDGWNKMGRNKPDAKKLDEGRMLRLIQNKEVCHSCLNLLIADNRLPEYLVNLADLY